MMQSHVAYWSNQMSQGRVLAFGPVADPKGTFGIGILQLPDDADPAALAKNDPAIQAQAGFSFEIHPMPRLIVPAPAA